jgi:addiction module HigA family antidote
MHPGTAVRQDCIEKNGLSVTDAARILGVDRQTLSNLLNARSGISPEMAVRLEKAFGTPARELLIRQLGYELSWRRSCAGPTRSRSSVFAPSAGGHGKAGGSMNAVEIEEATLGKAKTERLPIPLPPLDEQHRIVAKVDRLMALCDRLEASLTSAAATRRSLLDALLTETLAPAEDRELEAAE